MQEIAKIYKFIEQMPKVELHVHLEGSIKPEALLIIAQRNNIKLPAETPAELTNFFKFKNFRHFVEVYTLITSCLKTVDDYELISYQFGCECARQNIRYAEVTFSLATNCRLTGLRWQEILEGLNAGRARAIKEFSIDWGWVFDILRDEQNSQTWITDAAISAKNDGVVAVGLSGNEDTTKAETFAKNIERTHKNGLGFVPHAGETCGPESIWPVINLLNADRIGHGVRCIEDPNLMDFLKQKQIPLEICPTSNICIGVFQNFKTHSLRSLWDAGIYITINSDDPALFNTDLNNEYKILVNYFDFSLSDIEKVSLNALHASFLPASKKQQLDHDFKELFSRLQSELIL
jgi:adenosine deaminase